jgi:ketosteroid isomerase-like protein
MTNAKLSDLYQTIDACDWDALEGMLHADVVYERPGYDPLVGRERVLRFYREERLVASGRHEVYGVLHDGDRAACWGRMRGTLRDGSPADVQFSDVYSFQAGKIRTRRSYFFSPAV